MKWKTQRRRKASGQLLLVVRRDEHHRALLRHDLLAGLEDREAHLVELAQQVVGELEIGLVDLVDEQHVRSFAAKAWPSAPKRM